MEGTNLISKAGMIFNSDDTWNLIPLTQENLQAFLQTKFKVVNLTCKFWLEICGFFQLSSSQIVSPESS